MSEQDLQRAFGAKVINKAEASCFLEIPGDN